MFTALKQIPGFDRDGRVTIVDQEKSIDTAFRSSMEHARLFLDALHVRKNMAAYLGAERANGTALYDRALYAPTTHIVDEVKALYGPRQKEYLSKFPDAELYRAYAALDDLILTSQGAESQMSASIRNMIRGVEPQTMLKHVVETQRNGFLKRKASACRETAPVPPVVQRHLAQLIARARPYQSSVKFVPGTDQGEAVVTSATDASKTRRVVFNSNPQTPPSCCAYSMVGDGFPCYHGAAAICERTGTVNVHKFIARRNLTVQWKQQYADICFDLPRQVDMDDVIVRAQGLVDSGEHVRIPVALPPPRGRPVKQAGKRKRSWYERGPQRAKREYTCSLCLLTGHTARSCELRQVFDEDAAAGDDGPSVTTN